MPNKQELNETTVKLLVHACESARSTLKWIETLNKNTNLRGDICLLTAAIEQTEGELASK